METPLTLAAMRGDVEIAKLLISKRASIHVTTASGWTPLHCAVIGGKKETVLLMLAMGVDPAAVDKNGETALDMAKSHGKFDIAAVIRGEEVEDRYSVPQEWSHLVAPSRYDFFISYRHKLAAGPARALAADLRHAGCTVYFDADTISFSSSSLVTNENPLKREIFIAVRSSDVMLFFESMLEAEIIPSTHKSQTAFSWTMFEKTYANRVEYMGSGPADKAKVELLAKEAMRRRQENWHIFDYY